MVFTDPQAASVGAAEATFSATARLSEVAKTATYMRAYDQSNGFMTLLSDGERLTGAYALGPEAGEWLQQATLAIRARVPLEVLRDIIQPFPTFSEIYVAALTALHGRITATAPASPAGDIRRDSSGQGTAIMADDKMMAQVAAKDGFIAALDQSGGSTPGALRQYGIPDSAYGNETEMFRLMHEMRVRIMTAPAFTGGKVIAAILFEGTMDGQVEDRPVPTFLWEERGIVPFVKVDKGLEPESDGVSLMKPMPSLDTVLTRAMKLGIFGTKMRSVVRLPSKQGIAAVVRQQFDLAVHIAGYGLMPVIEPEVLIKSPDKAGAEALLRAELIRNLDALPAERQVMLKLTIPEVPDFYRELIGHKHVTRVVALSGGYTRAEACKRLAANRGLIASFSRALLDDLRHPMSDAEFDATLANAIDEIYRASTLKA